MRPLMNAGSWENVSQRYGKLDKILYPTSLWKPINIIVEAWLIFKTSTKCMHQLNTNLSSYKSPDMES